MSVNNISPRFFTFGILENTNTILSIGAGISSKSLFFQIVPNETID